MCIRLANDTQPTQRDFEIKIAVISGSANGNNAVLNNYKTSSYNGFNCIFALIIFRSNSYFIDLH